MAKYVAIHRGFCGVAVREPGDKFEFHGKPGPWMKPLDGEGAKSPAGKAAAAKKGGKPADPKDDDDGEGDEA